MAFAFPAAKLVSFVYLVFIVSIGHLSCSRGHMGGSQMGTHPSVDLLRDCIMVWGRKRALCPPAIAERLTLNNGVGKCPPAVS